MMPKMPTILTPPTTPTSGGRGGARFMSYEDWQARNPEKDPSEYMTDDEGNPIDSRSDAGGSGIQLSDRPSLTPSADPTKYDVEQGGAGRVGGREAKYGRKEMVTTAQKASRIKKASILDPNPNG